MSKLVPQSILQPSQRHQELLDNHFVDTDQGRWSIFKKNLRSKSFVDAVRQDDRADDKLKLYAENMGRHLQAKVPAIDVQGTRKYQVKYHSDIDRFSCSCPDWGYKKSPQKSNKADCKHISRIKQEMEMKTKSAFVSALGSLVQGLAGQTMGEHAADRGQIGNAVHAAYRQSFPKRSPTLKEYAVGGLNPLDEVDPRRQALHMLKHASALGRAARRILGDMG